jgi:hypothetical protein
MQSPSPSQVESAAHSLTLAQVIPAAFEPVVTQAGTTELLFAALTSLQSNPEPQLPEAPLQVTTHIEPPPTTATQTFDEPQSDATLHGPASTGLCW